MRFEQIMEITSIRHHALSTTKLPKQSDKDQDLHITKYKYVGVLSIMLGSIKIKFTSSTDQCDFPT